MYISKTGNIRKKYLPSIYYVKADSLEIEVITGGADREEGAKKII